MTTNSWQFLWPLMSGSYVWLPFRLGDRTSPATATYNGRNCLLHFRFGDHGVSHRTLYSGSPDDCICKFSAQFPCLQETEHSLVSHPPFQGVMRTLTQQRHHGVSHIVHCLVCLNIVQTCSIVPYCGYCRNLLNWEYANARSVLVMFTKYDKHPVMLR